jgi:hypothetical protein
MLNKQRQASVRLQALGEQDDYVTQALSAHKQSWFSFRQKHVYLWIVSTLLEHREGSLISSNQSNLKASPWPFHYQ